MFLLKVFDSCLTLSAWVCGNYRSECEVVRLLLSATPEVTVKRRPIHIGGSDSSLTRNREESRLVEPKGFGSADVRF